MAESCGKEALVCKYNPTGYCKFGLQCLKTHNNILCKDRVCRNEECSNQHPKTCREFAQNKFCSRQDNCAYAHQKSNDVTEIAVLEREIKLIQEEKVRILDTMEVINVKLSMIERNESEMSDLRLEVMDQRNKLSDLIVNVEELEHGKKTLKPKEKKTSFN